MEHSHTHVDISTRSIVKFILIVLAFLLLYVLKDVIIIFLLALIIASAIAPFANWLEAKGLPRIFGVLLLYLVVFSLIVLLFSLVVPFISQDLAQLTNNLPDIINRLSTSLDDVQQDSRYFDFVSEIQNILDSFGSYLQQFSQSALALLVSIFGGIFAFVAVIVVSFYLSVMKGGIDLFLKSVVPDKHEKYVVDLWKRAEMKVGRWLQGQLLLALIVGLLVYVGLSLLGVKYALLLGILAMVLEIVPIAGPVLAAIPAIILAFIDSTTLGIWVILFYLFVQQLENHVLTPIILGKTVGLNPVVVIIALLIGANLGGIVGMILAVPIATILVELVEDIAKHKESKRLLS